MRDYEYYEEKRPRGGWVVLILATIAILFAAYPYMELYPAFRSLDKNIMELFKQHATIAALFIGLSVVWFILTIAANVKFSRHRRYYGRNFGDFLGNFFVFLEYAGYALLIVLLFI